MGCSNSRSHRLVGKVEKSEETRTFLRNAVFHHPQIHDCLDLQGVNEEAINEMIDSMQYCQFRKGDYITRKGETADSIHVIMTGTVKINDHDADKGGQVVFLGTLKAGDLVGEIGFLDLNHIRTADAIVTSGHCQTMKLDRTTFWNIIDKMWVALSKDLTKWNIPGCHLSLSERQLLTNFVSVQRFSRGQYILKKGEVGKNLYLILTGFVKLDSNEQLILGPNNYFGEESLASLHHEGGQPDDAHVVSEDCNILVIQEAALKKIPTFAKFVTATLTNASKLKKKKGERTSQSARSKILQQKIAQNHSTEDHHSSGKEGTNTLTREEQLKLDESVKKSNVLLSDQICTDDLDLCVIEVFNANNLFNFFGLLGTSTSSKKRSGEKKSKSKKDSDKHRHKVAEEGQSHKPFSNKGKEQIYHL